MDLDEYKKVRATFMKNAQKVIAKEFKEFFDKYPNIDAIKWDQYAPHFNDGEPCEFNRHEFKPRVIIKKKDDPKEIGTAELISGLEADDDGFYESWDIDDKTPLGKALSELEDKFDSSVEDVFRETFGDSATVIATRKGFKTEDCYHD